MLDLFTILCTLISLVMIVAYYHLNKKQSSNADQWLTLVTDTYFNPEPGKKHQTCTFELQRHKKTFEIRLLQYGDYIDYDLSDVMNEKKNDMELDSINAKYDLWFKMISKHEE